MNKMLRHFLSGGTLPALQLCALGSVARAGTTISGAHGNVTVAAATSFIEVTGTAVVTGNVTNNATIGPHNFALEVLNGASISGSLINAAPGILSATATGIFIQTNAALGGIVNAGKIQVARSSGTAKGITYRGHGAAGENLTNSGTIQVSVIGTGTNSIGTGQARGVNELVTANRGRNAQPHHHQQRRRHAESPAESRWHQPERHGGRRRFTKLYTCRTSVAPFRRP